MLQQLTNYLFQFNKVTIPFIGTFELVAHPAQLDVANKNIAPPFYETHFTADEEISTHQLQYFEAALVQEEEATQTVFKNFGVALKNKLQQDHFIWSGIGTLAYHPEQGVQFFPAAADGVMTPIDAERVIRQGAQHQVLVGDQMLYSDETAESIHDGKPRRNYIVIIAWIVAVLAVLFIIYYLYVHHFSTAATGLQQKVTTAVPAPSYK